MCVLDVGQFWFICVVLVDIHHCYGLLVAQSWETGAARPCAVYGPDESAQSVRCGLDLGHRKFAIWVKLNIFPHCALLITSELANNSSLIGFCYWVTVTNRKSKFHFATFW